MRISDFIKETLDNLSWVIEEKLSNLPIENIMHRVVDFVILRKKPVFAGLFTIVVLMFAVTSLSKETEKMQTITEKWEEQLPDTHWMKHENNELFVSAIYGFLPYGKGNIDLCRIGIGQNGDIYSFVEKVLEREDKRIKSSYVLRYADTGKKVRIVKLKQGESVRLAFYCDKNLQEFDITEEEFMDMYNQLVLSCIDEPEIATIYDGVITAKSKGKTVLQICCDGYYWEYIVKVK